MTTLTGNVVTYDTSGESGSIYGDVELAINDLAAAVGSLDAQHAVTPIGTGAIAARTGLVPIVNKTIDTVVVVDGGSGYTVAPVITLLEDVGNADATLTAVLAVSGSIKVVNVGGIGTGYKWNDALIFTGGGGTGAAGHIETVGGNIVRAVVTNGGTGYTSAPTVTVTTAGGSGKTLTAVVGFAVDSVTLTAAGTGFAKVPKVSVAAPTVPGTVATVAVTLTDNVAVCALTLAGPEIGMPSNGLGGNDGQSIFVVDTIGAAHTITTPADKLSGSKHIATFGGAVGDCVKLVAFNGVWFVAGSTNVVLS